MANDRGIESGLTKFLNAMYRCFRLLSKILICCQFCECKCKTKRRRNRNSTQKGKTKDATTDDRCKVCSTDSQDGFIFPKRYILAIMTFLGFMNMYALRVNLNVALGAMVNNHTVEVRGMTFLRVGYNFLCFYMIATAFYFNIWNKLSLWIFMMHDIIFIYLWIYTVMAVSTRDDYNYYRLWKFEFNILCLFRLQNSNGIRNYKVG